MELTDDQITTVSNEPAPEPAPAPEVDPSTGEPIVATDKEAIGDDGAKQDPWYKRRIDELSRDKHEARRHAERLERQLEENQELLRRLTPQEPKQPEGLQPPDPRQFAGGEYDPRYLQAMHQYTRESAILEARQAVAAEYEQREEQQRRAEHQAALATSEAEARKVHPDYDNVVRELVQDQRLISNPVIQQAILSPTMGPEIAYVLGRDPDLAQEITRLPPFEAAMRLAALVQSPAGATRQQGSQAPTPARPLGTGGSAPTTSGGKKTYAEMTTAEYIAARNAEELANRRARAGK